MLTRRGDNRIMQPKRNYQIKPSVVCTEMDDGAVLLDVETKYYYHLNETSLRIWDGYRQNMQVPQIVSSLIDSFDVDERHACDSVFRFTQQLEEEGLIRSV